MKQIIFIIAILLLHTQTMAQGDGAGRVRELRIAYVKSKLQLSETQANSFWPLYANYLNEKSALRLQYRDQFKQNNNELLSQSEAYKKVDDNFEYKEKDLALSKRYKVAFLKILTPQQLAILYQSEQEFKQMLLQRLKGR
jgi:hypothetical protein